ncbi:MAG: sulfite exporter TauE/SafE family protein [Chloroflexi bacterium]|nr:sulfite exporter TauE/SafE family protein [Chloroflexota bacterium]
MSIDPRFSLLGLLIGFLIGLTGMGGGSLMTPIMILVMGVKPLVAVGTDLAYGALTRMVGASTHLRQGTVHRRTAYLLAAGSVPATILGVGLVTQIKSSNPSLVDGFLLRSIAWALILVAIILGAKPFLVAGASRLGLRTSRDWRGEMVSAGERHLWVLPAIGAVVGFLVGLTSVGAGSLVIVTLFFLYPRWQVKDLVGTDVFHAAILVSGASIAHFVAGDVNVPMMASLLIGSIPGVLLGSRLVLAVPEPLLRLGLASVLLVSGMQLL